MAAFTLAARERFAATVAAHLTRAFPARAAQLGPVGLAEVAAAATAAARADGMTGVAATLVWGECTLLFGPAPWQADWAAPLARRDWPDEVRHQRFVELATMAIAASM